MAFGAGMGFSAVSPWSNSGPSVASFTTYTGLYLVVVAMLSSIIGGYIAGRLRTRWVGVHSHEVFFRDTAHGFLAWAFATVLSAAALGTAASFVVGGAAAGLPQAAAQSSDVFVDSLLRTDPAANRNPIDAPTRREVARLFTANLGGTTDNTGDRVYLVQLIAANTGISPADAEKRLSDVTTQAKVAADKARKAAARLSLWLAASLLIGAFSASLAATEGGVLRDRKWSSVD